MDPFPRRLVRHGTMASLGVAVTSLLATGPVLAQEAEPDAHAAQAAQAADLAKEIQNLLASVVTLPFQVNFNEGVGELDRRVANLNF